MKTNLDQYVNQVTQSLYQAESHGNGSIHPAETKQIPVYLSTTRPYVNLSHSSIQPPLSQLQECAKQHHFLEQQVTDHVLQKMLQAQLDQTKEDDILLELQVFRLAFKLLKRFYREKGCPIDP